MRNLPALFFAVVALGAVVFTTWQLLATDTVDAARAIVEREIAPEVDDKTPIGKLRRLAKQAECDVAVPLWLRVLDKEPEDLDALKAVANCARTGGINEVVERTAALVEDSRVLSTIPVVLGQLELDDNVPILDKAKDPKVLRLLGQLERQLGRGDRAVETLLDAVSLEPENAQVRFELAYALVDEGKVAAARPEFRQALASSPGGLRMSRLYAIAMGYPAGFAGVLLGVLGMVATLTMRDERLAWLDRSVGPRAGNWVIGLFLGAAVGAMGWFWVAGDRVAFGLLAAAILGSLCWLVFDPFRDGIARGIDQVGRVAAGNVDRQLERVSPGVRLGILAASSFTLLFLVPLIRDVDLRLGAGFLTVMLLFSTLGSLLLGMLRESASISTTLRWLAMAGTLPYLLYFLYVDRRTLLTPLRAGEWLPPDAQARLAGYLLIWGLGLAFALLLSRILSRSILEPVDTVMRTLDDIEHGDFDARAEVDRRDEIGALASAVNHMAAGLKQREEIKQTFRLYVDEEVANMLMDGGGLTGEVVDATVLFSDLRGFTTMSDGREPQHIVELLNAYFAKMAPIVREHGGVVDKFLGDGMLAVWDVPRATQGEIGAVRAVRAGLAMLDALAELNAEWGSDLQMGIGINCGSVVSGPVGSPDRLEYTVIGDTVNTAQRVESVSRGDAPLQVTAAVAERVGEHFELEERAPVPLKGKAEPLALFKVVGARTA